ncbi:hypothetical protein MNB_SV-10-1448 [hydrothermal vent metagenome]|uniref:Uncharacterized protein n=1 Tax=hydrothermal vent metagenome TaxID=652676 RepID=A0A1W1CB39_9ZZZZ
MRNIRKSVNIGRTQTYIDCRFNGRECRRPEVKHIIAFEPFRMGKSVTNDILKLPHGLFSFKTVDRIDGNGRFCRKVTRTKAEHSGFRSERDRAHFDPFLFVKPVQERLYLALGTVHCLICTESDLCLDDPGIHRRHGIFADGRHDIFHTQYQNSDHTHGKHHPSGKPELSVGKFDDPLVGTDQFSDSMLIEPFKTVLDLCFSHTIPVQPF